VQTAGQGLDTRKLISEVANTGRPTTVIVDKTTDPFCLDGVDEVLSDGALLVSVESLSKYAQYGDALALGGVIALIAKKDSEAAKRADTLYKLIRQHASLQGQHMDPRLAWSLAPTRRLLEWRLTRMRRNAVLIAEDLRHDQIGKVYHAEVDSRPSTFLYVRFELRKEHKNNMQQAVRAVEEYTRSLVHKSIGDDSYEVTFGGGDRPRHLFHIPPDLVVDQ
jgi:cystathionine beta-lyase/cystathionine gamma-synthase